MVEVHDLLASDDHFVALGKSNIAGVDTQPAVVYQLRDGKISDVWSHEGEQNALDEAPLGSTGRRVGSYPGVEAGVSPPARA